jgi:hypothetical protein
VDAQVEFVDKLIIDFEYEKEVMYIFLAVTNQVPTFDTKELEQIKIYDLEEAIYDFENNFKLSGGFLHSFRHLINSGRIQSFRNKLLSQ